LASCLVFVSKSYTQKVKLGEKCVCRHCVNVNVFPALLLITVQRSQGPPFPGFNIP